MKKKILGIIGLILNLIGTILLAISLKIVYCGGVKICGLPSSFSIINASLFKLGIGLIVIGFLLQLIEKFMKK